MRARSPGEIGRLRRSPPANYWFIFYSEPLEKTWVVPAAEIVSRAQLHKWNDLSSGYDVRLSTLRRPRGSREPFFEDAAEFEEFLQAFDLLAGT